VLLKSLSRDELNAVDNEVSFSRVIDYIAAVCVNAGIGAGRVGVRLLTSKLYCILTP